MNINGVTETRSDITEMLAKIREMSSKTTVFSEPSKVNAPSGFDEMLSFAKGSVEKVNDLQTTSEAIKTAYVTGDGNVSMSQIVTASQKSKLAFEGLLAVRNKILEAYKEIMNMPV